MVQTSEKYTIENDGQIKITEKTPLLDKKGRLVQPGYCVTNLYDYSRKGIKTFPLRIKEWDFYQISNKRYCLQVTSADISMGAMSNAVLFDLLTGVKYESAPDLKIMSMGKYGLSDNPAMPFALSHRKKDFSLRITSDGNVRNIAFRGKCRQNDFNVNISVEHLPDYESLVMAVPFEKGRGRYFYLNQKTNCMPVSGAVTVGDVRVEFSPEDSFCVLDWGRGVWPYHCVWYWGNGSTRLDNGDIFGFEIGWGFGNMSAATENTLFYNGKAHKIGEIFLENDENDWMKPWVFTSSDGRFEMTMTPVHDNITKARVLCVGNVCHQVFGRWNGKVVLDDGRTVEIHDMTAFCEKSDNMW